MHPKKLLSSSLLFSSVLISTVFLVACGSSDSDSEFGPSGELSAAEGADLVSGPADDSTAATADPVTTTDDPAERISPLKIRDFIWKPESERNGLLVVLVNPEGVTVRVNGSAFSETLVNSGPSNGRGTTARGSRSGCSYGAVSVEFFDRNGDRIEVSDGRQTVDNPSGCDRVEFLLP